MTHTPGPWKAGKGVDDDETRCFVTQGIPGRPEYLIAEIQNGAPGDCLETEVANAQLIAAAPDMLQALREVEGDCYYLPEPGDVQRCGFCQADEGEPHEPECTMHFVLAALAKAVPVTESRRQS